ncbi:hypothetical protein [Thiomicrorhabdus sp. Kp2]|uniref:hypothetical protein n=1 Tax=Thiomicrorhabdus sp. Kp2 TaxID=1123518 RepID=UPI000421EA48|nr:hypothetical protein [Thiomicrorhabdus sp. Kp2]
MKNVFVLLIALTTLFALQGCNKTKPETKWELLQMRTSDDLNGDKTIVSSSDFPYEELGIQCQYYLRTGWLYGVYEYAHRVTNLKTGDAYYFRCQEVIPKQFGDPIPNDKIKPFKIEKGVS